MFHLSSCLINLTHVSLYRLVPTRAALQNIRMVSSPIGAVRIQTSRALNEGAEQAH